MSTYYTYSNPYREGVTPSNELQKLPPGTSDEVLNYHMRKSLHKTEAEMQNRPRIANCCVGASPCKTWVSYRPRYSGCGDMWQTWKQLNGPMSEMANQPTHHGRNFEVGQKAPQIWVADHNPLHYEYAVRSGSQWWPEPYAHPHSRQMFAQYLMSTLNPQMDKNTKQIDSINDTLPVVTAKYGQPQFVSF